MLIDKNMKQIEQSYVIKAPINEVWQAFISPNIIDKWGGGPAIMDDKEGTKFSLWGGEVYGTNIKVIPKKLLVQDWYSGDGWEQPSRLTLSFIDEGDKTIINLSQGNVPSDEVKDISQGWKDYYFDPIKDIVEK